MTILVVDDDPDVKVLFEQLFRRELRGGQVHLAFCSSGEQAVAYLAEHPTQTQLVLSDSHIPGMSGPELLRHLHAQVNKPPFIILITAYGDEQTRQQALLLGADYVVAEPVDFQTVKNQLLSVT